MHLHILAMMSAVVLFASAAAAEIQTKQICLFFTSPQAIKPAAPVASR
jgi:hypothetical protein